MVGGREKRHQTEPQFPRSSRAEHQSVVGRGRAEAGMKRKAVLLPVGTKRGHRRRRQDSGRVVVDKSHRDRTDGRIGGLGIERTLIDRMWPNGNAPEPFVRDAGRLRCGGAADGKSQTQRQCAARPSRCIHGHRRIGITRLIDEPVEGLTAPVVLESAVSQKFGIQAAIVGVVDLLSHQAIKHRAYFALNLVYINRQRRRLCSASSDNG